MFRIYKNNTMHLLLSLCVIIFILLASYGASGGLRGSDQYWYVDDVNALLIGNGPISNNIYPASIFQETQLRLPRPFVHNFPIIYMVLPAAMLLGPFNGWILINLLSSFLSVLLIGLTVKRSTGDSNAAMGAGLFYLLLPVVFWNSIQTLSEPSLSFGVSLFLWIYVSEIPSFRRFLFLTIVTGLLFLSKSNFILLFPLILLSFLIHTKSLSRNNLLSALVLIAILFFFFTLSHFFFASNFDYSYIDALMMATSKYPSNMAQYYAPESLNFSLLPFLFKVAHNLKTQITGGNLISFLLFYLPFNASVAGVVLLAVRKRIIDRPVQAAAVFVGIFLITIAVFQNQFRYQLMAWPAVVVALFHLAQKQGLLKPQKWKAVFTLILVFSAGLVFFALAREVKTSGEAEAQIVHEIQQQLTEIIPESSRVMLISGGGEGKRLLMGHALWPRLVVFTKPDFYSQEQFSYLMDKTNCDWLLAQKGEAEKSGLPISHNRAVPLPAPYGDFELYNLAQRKNK
ncbi:hypothetical protein GKODMF_08800 [Candidatus Electrothrix gigas]